MVDTELLITPVNDDQVQKSADLSIGLPEVLPEILMTPNIGVIGVGGAGGNAVNNMIRSHLDGVSFVVANTDAQVMNKSLTHERIQLGSALTQGLGAGSKPEVGKAAAEESADKIKEAIKDFHLLFIAAGMGGGTGTGASPVVAKIAKEMGILTVGVVTKPFRLEGPKRMRVADAGIEELEKYVDTLIVVPNQNLFRVIKPNTSVVDAFKMADDVLFEGVKSITDFILMPMLINLDFADLKSILSEHGKAMMGSGEASGEDRALVAAQKAISNPLLDISIKGAKGVLVNVSGGLDLTLDEVDAACNRIQEEVGEDTTTIFGTSTDEQLAGKVRVAIVATGLSNQKIETTPSIRSILNVSPETVVVVPEPSNPPQETSLQTSVQVTVETKQTQPFELTEPEEKLIDKTSLSSEDFIPPAPSMPTASQTQDTSTEEDFFGTLLDSYTKEEDPVPTEEINEKKSGFFPSLFKEKNFGEKEKKRLSSKASDTFTQERELPALPDEEALEVPSFLRR